MKDTSSCQDTEMSAISASTELKLSNEADVESGPASDKHRGVYVAGGNKKWRNLRKCLLRKSCAVYTLIIAFIWLLYTLPIILFSSVNATFNRNDMESVNNTKGTVTDCSRNFFLDNSSGLCRPECGEWDQYSPATRRAVYGVNITFALLTIIVCMVAIVWSIFRHKIMFHYPNIILIYITLTRIALCILHLVGYTDEKALYCTSRDRVTSFEEGSAYCNIIGSATTFISSFDLTGLCFHLGTVLFTAYFPFRARELVTKGRYKYLHFVAVVSIVGVSGLLVGFQFALGGYSRTVAPIFCLGSPGSAFLFGVVPACLTSAIFLTFVMILLFKIIELKGWRLKSTGENVAEHTPSGYVAAQRRLVLIFCVYGVATLINFSAYSVVIRYEMPFSQALEEYFECESLGNSTTRLCLREKFENLDPTRVTFPLTIVGYIMQPVSTLIYVAHIEKLFNLCRTKLSPSGSSVN